MVTSEGVPPVEYVGCSFGKIFPVLKSLGGLLLVPIPTVVPFGRNKIKSIALPFGCLAALFR